MKINNRQFLKITCLETIKNKLLVQNVSSSGILWQVSSEGRLIAKIEQINVLNDGIEIKSQDILDKFSDGKEVYFRLIEGSFLFKVNIKQKMNQSIFAFLPQEALSLEMRTTPRLSFARKDNILITFNLIHLEKNYRPVKIKAELKDFGKGGCGFFVSEGQLNYLNKETQVVLEKMGDYSFLDHLSGKIAHLSSLQDEMEGKNLGRIYCAGLSFDDLVSEEQFTRIQRELEKSSSL